MSTVTTTGTHGFSEGDWITIPVKPLYSWPVRLAAWLCRVELPTVNGSFVVTAVVTGSERKVVAGRYKVVGIS